ncbi:GNAT family N-acetyltransferase [Amycolatopsis sp. NPDC059021]|uniref:GNAT family N-acetyltransferase n=1 Tax=Amycolatopsis sp. NPDC059021 TaxID=3346704 RepID=UPI003670891C
MISVRRLTPADVPVLRDLRLRSLADTPENLGDLVAVEAARPDAEWVDSLRERVWFAGFDDDTPIALVCGRPDPSEWLLYSMWVVPSARGNGLAARLVAEVRAAAVENGAQALVLQVFEDNLRARRIYERLGFLATGVWEEVPGKGRRELLRLAL